MSIVLEQLTKRYDGYPVVNNVSLEIKDGEFFVLLGSSGSGKTTILNLIAGLTTLDHGRILLHGRDVTALPTQKRRVGFVFQNYALFQYMTVAENVEFGLSIQKVPKAERQSRREELLDLVGLAGLGNRLPRQLSGGQQQRVALARALAYDPDVLLLDEPLGALDAKIRVELRRSLRAVQRTLGIATILVTHDQDEAFSLADRIGVMSFGRLLEVGTPDELYQRPKSEFVATFLGSANLLVGLASGNAVRIGSVRIPADPEPATIGIEQRVQALFRPEDVSLAKPSRKLDCPILGAGVVEDVAFAGPSERLRILIPPIPGVRTIAPAVPFGSESILIEATRSPDEAKRFPLKPGDTASVGIRRIHTLDHPGISLLLVTDGALRSQAALSSGGQMARLMHAKVTLLGCGDKSPQAKENLHEARKQLGSGLVSLQTLSTTDPLVQSIASAVQQQPHDMIIIGFDPQGGLALAEQILNAGDHHLLLVPCPQPPPSRVLICVAGGEPGKEDILFAGRLARHLGAEVTLMTVVDQRQTGQVNRQRYERFLEDGVKTLQTLGVPANGTLRSGMVAFEILAELKRGEHDLLVLGAPLLTKDGSISLNGVVEQILAQVTETSTLIVRSRYVKRRYPQRFENESVRI
jgi:sulfate/thiosulfate transport system ATP-binding protein